MDLDKYKAKLLGMDFLIDADNVYRTKHYIVKQKVSTILDEKSIAYVVSKDTFYLRTPQRDADYELAFVVRGKHKNGRRIRTGMSTRTYVD